MVRQPELVEPADGRLVVRAVGVFEFEYVTNLDSEVLGVGLAHPNAFAGGVELAARNGVHVVHVCETVNVCRHDDAQGIALTVRLDEDEALAHDGRC